MYHFEKKTLKNLEIFEKKKGLFEKVTGKTNAPSSKIFFFFFFSFKKRLKGLMPLVQRHFFIWKIFSFFGKIWESWFFFGIKKYIYIYIYIHEQSTSNASWIFRIQRNIETWNKQRNKL